MYGRKTILEKLEVFPLHKRR